MPKDIKEKIERAREEFRNKKVDIKVNFATVSMSLNEYEEQESWKRYE